MDKNTLLATTVKGIDEATKDIRAFVNSLVDDFSFVETDRFLTGKSLLDGSEAAGEGILTGYASVKGTPVYVVAQNASVLGGSFGVGQAKKIINCMDNALKNQCPLISVIDSSGARIGEGASVMDGYASLIKKAVELQSSVLHIAVAKGKACGHMAAYLALADFVLAGNEAVITFNPPTVLASNANKPAKELFGVKVHCSESGAVDSVYSDSLDLRNKIALLIDYASGEIEECSDDANRESAELSDNISSSALLQALSDNKRCFEYSPDYAKEIKCCFAKVNGISVGIAVSDTASGEYLTLAGADKLTAFTALLSSLGIPLITLIDSKGITTTINEEQESAVSTIGNLFAAIVNHSAPKISVAVGNAIGVAYTALVSKGIGFDYSIAFSSATVSPLNLDTAVSLIYSDELAAKGNSSELRNKLEALYREENASSIVAAKSGCFDEIIPNEALRPFIANALQMLLGL